MDSNEFSKKWGKMKEQLKKDYPQLTEEDLVYEIGQEEALLLRLQKKLGKNRKEIDNWLSILG